MTQDRFFQTTRGKIVTELRRRGSASAADLAREFGLSPNAVRQQLVVLERDGLVVEKPVRRGPTKPTLEFSLTADADKLFPQKYDKMLDAVLREVRDQFGSPAVERIFEGLSRRAVERARHKITADEPEQKVAQLAEMLRENGVVAHYSLIDGGYALHEHNCPYSGVVKEHPEMCQVIHHVIDETIGGQHVQTESLAHGGKECRFEMKPTA
ncbi:MAG: helix-turn-helix domain-containing protein [Candidatus Eremiobacteraeota bacterium]|nr:helix-turn-helix domain-containing protein [Candidatus Eremiobacteraeota bacterium]MBV8433501.1 helix-turn-helix domain-containing protein [Candidatus Eremiobacteraeota bacterium]